MLTIIKITNYHNFLYKKYFENHLKVKKILKVFLKIFFNFNFNLSSLDIHCKLGKLANVAHVFNVAQKLTFISDVY